MRRISLKWKGLLGGGVVLSLVIYLEVLSSIINTQNWAPFPTTTPFPSGSGVGGTPLHSDDQDEGPLRVLLVADPQIIGEKNEIPFFGLFTRWDADRYLQRNYLLAQYHTQPHVVAFLGDLFDEGSSATDPEYRRYIRRFTDIFKLPRKQDPSPIEYVFLPGDNDVGGEGAEPVDPIKVKWFNQTFGDFRKELLVHKGPVQAQFIKMNLLLQEEYQDPTRGREHLISGLQPQFRILLSHTSLLQFKTNSVQTVLDKLRPQVIFSAHSHHSSYTKIQDSSNVQMTGQFLFGGRHPSQQWTLKGVLGSEGSSTDDPISPETLHLQTSDRMTLQLDRGSRVVHEISVPTCSYRMGVPHSGYGAFSLYKNGTLEYTVLWLPSRLNQLYAYLILYLITKFSIISWGLWMLVTWAWDKCRGWLSFISMTTFTRDKKGSYHKV